MNYQKFKQEQTNEMNKFAKNRIYFIFASSTEEFNKKLNELNLTRKQLTTISYGGYIKTEYLKEFEELLEKQEKEKHEYTLNNIYEVVHYECGNYELEINLSYTYKTLLTDILLLTNEEINEHKTEIQQAINDYKARFWELN